MATEEELVAGELIRGNGRLYRFTDSAFVLLKDKVQIALLKAVVKDGEGYSSYMLHVYDEDNKTMVDQDVDSSMLARFYASEMSIAWIVMFNGKRVSLSVKFDDPAMFVKFRNQFSVCLYEVNNPSSFDDLKAEDQRYVMESSRDDVVMTADSDEKGNEDGDDMLLEDPRDGAKVSGSSDDAHNSHLAVAYNNDRTFVVRGKNMGVFRADDEGVKFQTLVKLKDQKQKGFAPSQVLLHEQDHSMLFLNPEENSKVYRMDLERGDIVNEFDGGVRTINNLSHASKYANLDPGQEFVGINRSTMMRFDPRDKEFIVQSKAYAPTTKTMFSTMATTGAGYLAVGSENGDVRLYSELGKVAKTHLPGLGDPIIGVDTTEDGSFVLATTKNYILVIDTRVKGVEKGGFLKSMGKNKPTPVKLTIKPMDIIKYRMKDISFTPAHFNVGRSMERSIVASTGPFIVTWNFRHIKAGRVDSYQIKRYKDNIIADNFAFDDEEKIIVTLPDDVTVNRIRHSRKS